MTLLHMDGFDQFANINGAAATSTTLATAGYESTTSGTDSLVVTQGREAGSFAIRLRQDSTTGNAASLSKTISTADPVVTFGFAYMATERSKIVQIEGLIDLEWPVGCRLNGVDGEAIPIRNIWYYYELQVDKTAQMLRLYINNRLDIEAPLPAEAGPMTVYKLKFGSGVTGTAKATQLIDDLVMSDTAGTDFNARKGPIAITTRFPQADATADWEGSVAGPLWPLVSKRPPEASSYIQSNTSGNEATFTSATPLPNDSPVYALGIVTRALKTDIDKRTIGLVWGDGDNRLEKINAELTTENKYYYALFEAPAPGQAWTKEIVESNSFGVKVRP
ncbi:virion structural protein [Achromobacter phage vB_AchrS_AchV4]|uniref:Virion structural protein n=1 Tax=Achromobacter phage vB_AchrS_AchV4 TaxID=2796514 RepID=A0A7T3PGV9_9CAUD|nr:virion structural protein [Achromobacter phage vB_AchrS_AchV4]QPZ53253.1 virion structural protein [Achromobacter phage vB_AchrS_AchV4]